MNKITSKLDQLENRLQTLIEGHIAGLLPPHLSKQNLIDQMVAAMQAAMGQQDKKAIMVPAAFHIRVHPEINSQLEERKSLVGELANSLQQAGNQAGLQFSEPPMIQFVPTQGIKMDEIEVIAGLNPEHLAETHALEVDSDDETSNLPPNAFLIVNGTQIFPLEQIVVNIGRHTDNHLVIDDQRVSRHHAQLRASGGHYQIFDLDSTGGTFVNGRRVSRSTLYPKDVFSLAGIPLVYAQDESPELDHTQKYVPETSGNDRPTEGAQL